MTVPPGNVEDVYRLSPIQQGMLFHTLFAGKAAPYLDQFVSYNGRLDLPAMERAWRAVVQRHPVLRTSFFWEEVEEPVQLVHRGVELPFETLDWSDAPPEERERRLAALLEEDRARGFALDRAPLMRLTYVHWGFGAWRAVWTYHHMLLDGWSVGHVLQEVGALYAAERRQAEAVPAPPPALPARRPFRDYIGWLRQQDLAAAAEYWRGVLAGFAEPTALAIDRAPGRPVAVEDQHAEAERTLSEPLTAAVQTFARQHRVTLHTVVEGAWALALARFSGRRDVVFGNTVSGRPPALPGAEAMIGCFINTLPVRVQAPPEAEVVPWLRDLQRDQMEMRRFEYSPLVEIRKWAQTAGRIPAQRPLFEAILVFESSFGQSAAPTGQAGQAGTEERRFDPLQRTHFPLTVVVWPEREMKLRAGFYLGRFAARDVERFLEYFEALLAAFTHLRSGARLADLPALSAAEAAQLASWQAPRERFSADRCLHELFAAQAARRPDAVAVTGGDAALTYRELDERANQLANHLRQLGVGPEVPVGLCADRSPSLVAGLLGILKAGGAYVPLDPAHPAERLAFLIQDSGVGIVVTEDRFAPLLQPTSAEPRLVRLDGDAETLAAESREAPEPGAVPGNLAYVIYTSGSTGRPKGSLVTHANVARLLAATREPLALGERDVWTLFHSYAFDFSVWEIWGALAFGGRLVVVPYGVSRSPEAFHQLLRREGVTVLNQTPSAFAHLAEADEEGGRPLPDLRLVLFGGEALDPAILGPWLARYGDERPLLANLYGITETTVHVTLRPLSLADTRVSGLGGSPIGAPIADLSTPLLDRWGEPVPAGVPGEICVGGAGLARGYRNRPDLTAERFLPDAQADEPGARLYRSGDLARLREGARGDELEYLGRIDHQVKIRGFRIEPGEVEAELRRHPGVRQAHVLADGEGDERRLVAFVATAAANTAAGPAPEAAELREHLRERLPDYMVPPAWVFLPGLPLTPNGKVDAAALRRSLHGGGTALAVAPYEAPRSGLEQTVAALWQELLGVERVGVHDNFFDLGGHSILMIQVQRRLQEQLGRKLSMVDLLSHASVSALARFLAGGEAAGEGGEPEAELAAAAGIVQAERAEEGKSRLRQMRRAGRSAGPGSGDEAP